MALVLVRQVSGVLHCTLGALITSVYRDKVFGAPLAVGQRSGDKHCAFGQLITSPDCSKIFGGTDVRCGSDDSNTIYWNTGLALIVTSILVWTDTILVRDL